LAEEIENAPVNLPRSMISSVLINSVLGFAMLIAMLFCMGSPVALLKSESHFPFVEIFEKNTGSTGGATGMTVVILIITISGSIGLVAASSRMLWAFAREDGVPGSGFIKKIEPRTALPIWAICITTLVSLLLALIQLGSSATFSALTGLTVAAYYTVFFISASVMLHKRLTTPAADIFWGDFKLGKLGVPVTIAAMCYSIIGWFFSFWPPFAVINTQTFNFSLVVYFGVMILAIVWYFVHARKVYTGPKIEVR
jgi:choline transport protein